MTTSIRAFLSLIVFARAVDGVVEDVPDCKELTLALSMKNRRLLYAGVTTAIFKYPDSLRYNCKGERLARLHLSNDSLFEQKAGHLYEKLDRVTFEAELNGNSITASLLPWDAQLRHHKDFGCYYNKQRLLGGKYMFACIFF